MRLFKQRFVAAVMVAFLMACGSSEQDEDPFLPLPPPEDLALVSTLLRHTPVQGLGAFQAPRLQQGDPLAGEPEFFAPGAPQEAVTTFPDLGLSAADRAPRLLRRVDLGRLGVGEAESNAVRAAPASVFYLLHMSDLQVVDEQSPVNTPTNDFALGGGMLQGSYRPQGPYLAHMGNAMIARANALQLQTRPFDLAVHTGDSIEHGQLNELATFLTLLNSDGSATVINQSGDEAADVPANQPFVATGLRRPDGDGVPWLSVLGNHDILQQGNFPLPLLLFLNDPEIFPVVQEGLARAGITLPNVPVDMVAARAGDAAAPLAHRTLLPAAQLYQQRAGGETAGIDTPLTLDDFMSRADLFSAFLSLQEGGFAGDALPHDMRRMPLDKCAYVQSHLDPSAVFAEPLFETPVPGSAALPGHGFSAANLAPEGASCAGNVSYVPDDNPALRIVSLDLAYPYGGQYGALSRPQLPYDLSLLQDNAAMLAASTAFSTGLQNPDTGAPLFSVVPGQGTVNSAEREHAVRDGIAFLNAELAAAERDDQVVIVLSHQASEDLQTFNRFRIEFETVICQLLAAAAGQELDCDPEDGDFALGDIGLPVAGDGTPADDALQAGNVQARDLFASLLTGGLITRYEALSQDVVASVYGAEPLAVEQLAASFSLVFNLRRLLPDPVEAVGMLPFRRLLANSGRVVLHLAGHTHDHKILGICPDGTAIGTPRQASADILSACPSDPAIGAGYYEVRTASSIDWPLEWRLIELVDNNNGTLSIFTPVFTFEAGSPLADLGRQLALADELSRGRNPEAHPADLFTELPVRIPESVDAKLDDVSARHETIVSTAQLSVPEL